MFIVFMHECPMCAVCSLCDGGGLYMLCVERRHKRRDLYMVTHRNGVLEDARSRERK